MGGDRVSFNIITFGCQMNARDSSWLSARLRAAGYAETPLEDARVILLNTCSVREKPEKKVKNTLKRIRELTGNDPGVLVGVLGCVASQLGERLYEEGPQVRLVAGGDNIASVPEAITRLLANGEEKLAFLDFSRFFQERPDPGAGCGERLAFVNIMAGCDNFCSYCIVPFTRGRQKSRQMPAILDECRGHLANGVHEIVLLGQNVNAWGCDPDSDRDSFASLLRKIAELPGLWRLRFVTPHPRDFDSRTIAAFGELDNLCPRLHLPAQSGSDRILKTMRRGYDRAGYMKLVDDLRKARPDLALSTDLIVGFPGETEEDFRQTLSMMDECAFMSSFSFCYSDRPGTRASLMPDKVPYETRLERLARLQALQAKLERDWLAARVGKETEILLEGKSPRSGPDFWQGRDPWDVPVNVRPGTGAKIGERVVVRIVEAKRHSLLGIGVPDPGKVSDQLEIL